VGISPVPKWGDDLFPICFPINYVTEIKRSISYKYSYNLVFFKDTLAPLCVPWHTSKWNDFSFKPVYLSRVWDFENCTVALVEPKHEKYLNKLNNFLLLNLSSRVLKKDVLSLLGTLSHVTIVHQDRRSYGSYLSTLSSFIATFTNDHKPHYP
jgi:hypothetical protein